MPEETHEHYDAGDNYTGKTIVRRDSDWNEYAISRALALGVWEASKCPSCGNFDCLVPLPRDLRHVTWDEHGGQKFEVAQYRCLACGAADLIKRDWAKRNEKYEPVTGHAAPADGRMFITRPVTEEA